MKYTPYVCRAKLTKNLDLCVSLLKSWGSMFDFGSKVNGTMNNILVSNVVLVGNQGGWIGSPTWTNVVAEKGSTLPGGVPNGVTVR